MKKSVLSTKIQKIQATLKNTTKSGAGQTKSQLCHHMTKNNVPVFTEVGTTQDEGKIGWLIGIST